MTAERDAWQQEFAAVDPPGLTFLDGSRTNTAMDRTHGLAPSGRPVDGPVPHGHWPAATLTAAILLDGVIVPACIACDRPTNDEFFARIRSRICVALQSDR